MHEVQVITAFESEGKKQFIRVLQTFSACKTVKLASAIHGDDKMLRHITGEDLIAKEFKMHLNCYKEYTRVCSKQSLGGVSSLSVDEGSENETRTANNFKTVCSFIVDWCPSISFHKSSNRNVWL